MCSNFKISFCTWTSQIGCPSSRALSCGIAYDLTLFETETFCQNKSYEQNSIKNYTSPVLKKLIDEEKKEHTIINDVK